MHSNIPNGCFSNNMVLWGEPWTNIQYASRGYIVVPPALSASANNDREEYYRRLRVLLALVRQGSALQINWQVDSDYSAVLSKYKKVTDSCKKEAARIERNKRYLHYTDRMNRRDLRRERLTVYLSEEVKARPPKGNAEKLKAFYDDILGQLENSFNQFEQTMNGVLGADTSIRAFSDIEHYRHLKYFFNPSLYEHHGFEIDNAFRPDLSIQENVWNSDIAGNKDATLLIDGYHTSISTLKIWPSKTHFGIINQLTNLPFLDYSITMNIHPLNIQKEIDTNEKDLERLKGDYIELGKHRLKTQMGELEGIIDELTAGYSFPFGVDIVLRAWAKDKETLNSKTVAIENAINSMSGAQQYQTTLPTQARKIFAGSVPGWTWTSYKHRRLTAFDKFLADMLPFSGTFTGILNNAEALMDGVNSNLVGFSSYSAGEDYNSPQHMVTIGQTGAGKSAFIENVLLQTDPYYGFTVVIEEGNSYKGLVEKLNGQAIVVHPDANITINPFDTGQLPLNQLQLAICVAVVSKMIGEAASGDTQQMRSATISEYINLMYDDAYEDWKKNNRDRLPKLTRLALVLNKLRSVVPQGTTSIELYSMYQRGELEAEANKINDAIDAKELSEFSTNPKTASMIRNLAYAYFKPDEYPTLSVLIDVMRYSRIPQHDEKEINYLSTLLSNWQSDGPNGCLVDGATNIDIESDFIQFELGLIPEEAIEMKATVGLLITGFVRQKILSMPRDIRKRVLFEEVSRFLNVPGGEKIVSEFYGQMRKFNTWVNSITQQYAHFDQTRIAATIMGNSKQFCLLRQYDLNDVQSIQRRITLPDLAADSIRQYVLPEDQPKSTRHSSVLFFNPSQRPTVCGTVKLKLL